MSNDRREFLKVAGTLATGVVLGGISNSLTACSVKATLNNIEKFGIQLYTLRDVLPADTKGTLKKIASYGYEQIESYEHESLGMYWGMTSKDFKKYIDDLGLNFIASHCDHNKDFEKKADEAAAIGIKFLICPWIGPQNKLEPFRKAAESFNKAGEICKQRGIRFGYHNHDYSFKKIEGVYPQDILMQNTDKALVDFEMDMYWVITAGQDPFEWIRKYPERFTLVHVKDGRAGKTTTLGLGTIDYPRILQQAEIAGLKYFFVEQEDYVGTTPIAAAQANAEYMKKLRFKK
ncbi:MAG TPA: sugar phosphate isomerase/epimerase [Segetibacter sp.]|jgi:sugar phosphate isomerase/epimerase